LLKCTNHSYNHIVRKLKTLYPIELRRQLYTKYQKADRKERGDENDSFFYFQFLTRVILAILHLFSEKGEGYTGISEIEKVSILTR
jgi:hypothetical protein